MQGGQDSSLWKRRGIVLLSVSALTLSFLRYYGLPWVEKWQAEKLRRARLPRQFVILEEIGRVWEEFGIDKKWMTSDDKGKRIRTPADVPLIAVSREIFRRAEKLGGQVLTSQEDLKTRRVVIEIGYEGQSLQRYTLSHDPNVRRATGKIALVIDDFGYGFDEVTREFLQLPVTISIIPGLKESKRVAEEAAQQGREVMVHLPMEPLEHPVENDGYTLMTQMPEKELRERIRKALRAVPHSRGLNNHMGSKATLDRRVMQVLAEELKRAGYYFVDSRTNSESLAYQWAKQSGVSARKSEAFLDNVEGAEAIRSKLEALARTAVETGDALGIGHPRRETLEILKREIPRLERRGFRFVPVSEIR